jgi:hypothetical protein
VSDPSPKTIVITEDGLTEMMAPQIAETIITLSIKNSNGRIIKENIHPIAVKRNGRRSTPDLVAELPLI